MTYQNQCCICRRAFSTGDKAITTDLVEVVVDGLGKNRSRAKVKHKFDRKKHLACLRCVCKEATV